MAGLRDWLTGGRTAQGLARKETSVSKVTVVTEQGGMLGMPRPASTASMVLGVLGGASTPGVVLGVLGGASTQSTRISLVYSRSAFPSRTAFVFNSKFYLSNKLEVTTIAYHS